ncbi:MAG: tetratricopeptide repeat protein [Prevotella sp.]|nr:tetratricopeptide repeat protein [Prevotella sp.]
MTSNIYKWYLIGLSFVIFHLSFSPAKAQFNTDRLINVGRSALYYEDYVLSIQYFNQAISAKPYLYEPWFYRGVAKFYLDDFGGAEADCTEAIRINPYITGIYELRGLCRIRQKKYSDAITDYDKALQYDPSNQGFWYNRVLCRIQDKDFEGAHHDLDSMTVRWKKYAPAFSLKADVFIQQGDTLKGAEWLDKSLEIDPYNGDAWTVRAAISLSRRQWRDAEQQLGKAIHLKPKVVGNYINRALARYNINNLRGAMQDYDKAIDLDPNNFIGHYNRAQLRVQVGDDNRAILDFDYILQHEPNDVMARFNRALLRDRTGDLRGAIDDYSRVIDMYPNFWTGLHYRARCYRRLGMTAKAEMDEFRIFKAQMDKHLGIQPRLKKHQMRKQSDIDLDKYNQLVVADEQTVEHEYNSAWRGKVQNRKVETQLMAMYQLGFAQYDNGVNTFQAFDTEVERFNRTQAAGRQLFLSCSQRSLTQEELEENFKLVETLTQAITGKRTVAESLPLLLLRAVAYAKAQNFDDAMSDLTLCIQADSTCALAYWQRAVCQTMVNEFNASQGIDVQLKNARAMDDFNQAIRLHSGSAFLLYDRANLYAARKEYSKAIADYTAALKINPRLAEAYFNRGYARIMANQKSEGIRDLSRAGELGLYEAYSVIKQFSAEK